MVAPGEMHVGSESEEDMGQRGEILEYYRRLRAISMDHHNCALKFLSRPAVLEYARHLGLAFGQSLIVDSDEELTFLFDLATYSAKPGRSRAIDRYAKA